MSTSIEWDNPPPTGHPGEDYNCRCWAEPAFQDPPIESFPLEVVIPLVGLRRSDQALRDLYDAVGKVGYDKSQEEIINSPEMEIVRKKAAKALELIKASDFSESTEEFLEEPL